MTAWVRAAARDELGPAVIRTPLSKGNKWRFADPKSTSRGSFRAIAATRSGSGRGRGRPRTTLPLSMHLEIDAIFGKTLITRATAHSTRRADTMAPASVERCVGEFRASLTRGALPQLECVSFGVSKGLSLGIVAGAVLVKVPQINRIVAKGPRKACGSPCSGPRFCPARSPSRTSRGAASRSPRTLSSSSSSCRTSSS